MSYLAKCPACFNEQEFQSRHWSDEAERSWQDRMMSECLTDNDRLLINYALRRLRQENTRKLHNLYERRNHWSDGDEAGNPGYRQFLTEGIENREQQVVDATNLMQRLVAPRAAKRRQEEDAHEH